MCNGKLSVILVINFIFIVIFFLFLFGFGIVLFLFLIIMWIDFDDDIIIFFVCFLIKLFFLELIFEIDIFEFLEIIVFEIIFGFIMSRCIFILVEVFSIGDFVFDIFVGDDLNFDVDGVGDEN